MQWSTPDRELLTRLLETPEIAQCGFSVREGLTGAGVTLLKALNYFGNWRLTAGELVWTSANLNEPAYVATSVDDATRQTLLLILGDLQRSDRPAMPQARAG